MPAPASNGGLETEGAKAPRCEEGRRAEPKDPYRALRNLDEFDNIKPAPAALVFGDEGLRTAQPFGNIYLRELPGLPNASEQLLQSLLPWRAERLGHENRLFYEAGSSNNPDFGLSHIGMVSNPRRFLPLLSRTDSFKNVGP